MVMIYDFWLTEASNIEFEFRADIPQSAETLLTQ